MADQSHYNQFSRDVVPWTHLEHNQAELFGVQAGMEMLGLPNKHHNSLNLMIGTLGGFMHRDLVDSSNKSFTVSTDHQIMRSWPIMNESIQLPIDQPKENLVLSLMKQSELVTSQYQQQLFMQDRRMNNNSFNHSMEQPLFQLRNCKYLTAAQELLNEFCSLDEASNISRKRLNQIKFEVDQPSYSTSLNLQSMEFSELQKTKTKLLLMQEEVDTRSRRYCDQIKTVVASFEAVAGEGAATVYTVLASKAMSRHFRCLKDGIMVQIRTIKKMMGENDSVAPGTTKGETPRLKMLDQCIRQQKAFHQGMLEQHPWRPQRGLPERSVSILRAWLFEHFLNPYPNDVDKHILARQAGLSRSQVSNWFINARVRLWKPMVEEMYMEETKELESNQHDIPAQDEDINPSQNPNTSNPTSDLGLDVQKPLAEQLQSNSDQSLFSIINSNHHGDQNDGLDSTKSTLHQYHNFGISSYDIPYNNHGSCSTNAGRVSLTLGLQQHGGGGMSLSFSPNSNLSPLYPNGHQDVDHGQPVQFSILDGDSENLPYRKLMEAQLLHGLEG